MHEAKTMVDLSKAMDNHTYRFDGVFGERSNNEQIFSTALRPMVRHLFGARGGHGTCFAYGQTGSGKTVTMEGLGERSPHPGNCSGLYRLVAEELFRCVSESSAALVVRAGFFEIYRGKCFDLLNRKRKIEVMEDERNQQCLVGLHWVDLPSAEAMIALMNQTTRTTRATAQNEQSSRSHAILQLSVVEPAAQAWQDGAERCKLSLVDLAGSEWAAKAQSDDRSNRLDGAEINKSLLCLKECIRALGAGADHVPFRGSKLTQVLDADLPSSALISPHLPFRGSKLTQVLDADLPSSPPISPGLPRPPTTSHDLDPTTSHDLARARRCSRTRSWASSRAPS